MIELIFLFILGLLAIVFATVQDLKTTIVYNWISYGLIAFGLGFRFFYSLFSGVDFGFFYQGILGFLIFWGLSNIFYYSRMFAGGDSRIFMALGTILPIYSTFTANLKIFLLFVILFLLVGGLYGLIIIIIFGLKNRDKFKRDFRIKFKENKKMIYSFLILGILFLIFGFYFEVFFYFGILAFIFPYFFLAIKAIDDVCMIKKILTKDLIPGDWLVEDLKVGKKIIKADWNGLTEENIKLLQKKKKYLFIRAGIQFLPAFLISYVFLFGIVFFDLWQAVFNLLGF